MEWVESKTILQRVKGGDSWFGVDYNMNLYRGCCHGCIYCDSRSNCYQIENFDSVRIKKNALEILKQELRSRRRSGVVGMGSMSDSYNPFEARYELTRQAIRLLEEHGFGMSLETKSDLIVRDLDRLVSLKEKNPVIIKFSITAAEDELSRKLERKVCPSSARFAAMKALSDAGIFTGVLLMPVLPFLTDTVDNVRRIVELARDSGARFIYAMFGVTMRGGQREHLYDWLDNYFPGLSDGYRDAFGDQYYCPSPNAGLLYEVLAEECEKKGLLYRMEDIIKAYKEPYTFEQITLEL